MIIAFSTSSKLSSVAVFDTAGKLLKSADRESNNRASEACLAMLEELDVDVANATLFLADVGPGSFTGTRVGVVLAKTFAWANGTLCGGATAFDLVSAAETVVFPSKRDEWFIRELGQAPVRSELLPEGHFVGFGPGLDEQVFPLAKRFEPILSTVHRMSAIQFLPEYLIEPSISTPKKPLSQVAN